MESEYKFDLNEAVGRWVELNCQSDEFLPEDKFEIRSDLLSSLDDIAEEYNLTKEQAFKIACENMGDRFEWEGEMKEANQNNFQLKKVVLLFGGVIFYIFSYHFILCLNRVVLLFSNYINGNVEGNVANVTTFFNLVYFILIATMVAVYFWHKPVKWLFSKVTASTTLNIFVISVTFAAVVLELYLGPKVRLSVIDGAYLTFFFRQEITFRYVYFVVMLIGYTLLFKKYTSKFNIYI